MNATGSDAGASPEGSAATEGDGGEGAPLPTTAFLFERKVAPDTESLVAFDLATGQERVITDLRSDGSDGWSIDGFSISPDRTRVALASLYGPTKEDNETGLATQRIWTLDVNGGSFTRLTPVFKNSGGGQTGWRIDVRDPAFTADGASVIYDYGEGTSSSGYSRPWIVPSAVGSLPTEVPTSATSCPVVTGVVARPNTGEVLMQHVACFGGARDGLFLYPAGGGAPEPLVTDDVIYVWTATPRWVADGSLFVFVGNSADARSLYAYDMTSKRALLLVQGAENRMIQSGAVSPDGSFIVYCVREGDAENLHAVDFTVDPPTDRPLTTDGASCSPVF